MTSAVRILRDLSTESLASAPCGFVPDGQWNGIKRRDAEPQSETPVKIIAYVWDGYNIIAETVAQNNATNDTHNVCGLDLDGTMQGAGGVGGLLAVTRSDGVYLPCYDANGNITEYVSSNGEISAHYEYSPFGETVIQSGDLAATFAHRFSSKYYDAETGLYYYGYRFYGPALGRWLNRDPIWERGGNHPYRFVNNSPGSAMDVLGLWATDVHKDRTIQWAQLDGMPAVGAELIGKFDDQVDSDFDPTTITDSNWSWHFNRAVAGAEDTRLRHSSEEFDAAKKACTWTPGRNDNWKDAALHMGRALHLLQDWVAHGDFNRRQEMPSLSGYAFYEEVHYIHNGLMKASAPDNPDLDSTGPDGRPTIAVMTWRGTLKNGDRYFSAPFSSGTLRIRLTERRTRDLLRYFRNHVRAKGRPCGMCRRAFLGSADLHDY